MKYLLKEYKVNEIDNDFDFMDFDTMDSVSDKTTSIYITKYNGNSNIVRIPSEFNGIPIVGIWDYAFSDNSNITHVYLSNTIKCIDYASFQGCENLQYLEMTDSVYFMGSYCFEQCINLKEVVLSNNIDKIFEFTFKDCNKLVEINIPHELKSIEFNAFYNCINLPINIQNELSKYGKVRF